MRPKPPTRHPLGRTRRLRPGLALRRDPRLWWVVTTALALGTGLLVASTVSAADRARAAWGTERRVLVARHDLEPGKPIDHGDVELRALPAALVPASALSELPDRASVRSLVLADEVLVAERLAPSGLRGVPALLPAGTRAVAVPIEAGTAPPLAVGDRVDVLVTVPTEAAGTGPPGFVVAAGVVVVAVGEQAATLAVERDDAPRLAVALGQGAVTLALVGR